MHYWRNYMNFLWSNFVKKCSNIRFYYTRTRDNRFYYNHLIGVLIAWLHKFTNDWGNGSAALKHAFTLVPNANKIEFLHLISEGVIYTFR
ncbi:hypothetical protein D3C76_1177690 [compost metagenome]